MIVALAAVWKLTAHHHGGDYSGWLGPLYTDKADPGTVNFVPRPDWYFYFLFYLLRIFKWPPTVILGTIGIPTILPDHHADAAVHRQAPRTSPVAPSRRDRRGRSSSSSRWATLTYKGAVAKEALASEVVGLVPTWAAKEGFANNPEAVAGAKLFAQSACLNCHTYNGVGGAQFGAPDLTAEGSKGKGIAFQIAHLKCPSCVNPGSPMPSFAGFSAAQLHALATFLEASKGAH